MCQISFQTEHFSYHFRGQNSENRYQNLKIEFILCELGLVGIYFGRVVLGVFFFGSMEVISGDFWAGVGGDLFLARWGWVGVGGGERGSVGMGARFSKALHKFIFS